MFKNIAQAFQIELIEVLIYKLEEGIFFSELICEQNGVRIAIDSRTSDAVALSLRFKCPIYTSEEILAKAGIVIEITDDFEDDSVENEKSGQSDNRENKYELYSVEELEQLLHEAVRDEKYEIASEIRDEISRRKTGN